MKITTRKVLGNRVKKYATLQAQFIEVVVDGRVIAITANGNGLETDEENGDGRKNDDGRFFDCESKLSRGAGIQGDECGGGYGLSNHAKW